MYSLRPKRKNLFICFAALQKNIFIYFAAQKKEMYLSVLRPERTNLLIYPFCGLKKKNYLFCSFKGKICLRRFWKWVPKGNICREPSRLYHLHILYIVHEKAWNFSKFPGLYIGKSSEFFLVPLGYKYGKALYIYMKSKGSSNFFPSSNFSEGGCTHRFAE